MMTTDQLADLLRTVNVNDLAAEANVSTKTIYRLRHKLNSPTLGTVESLVAAVRRLKGRKSKAKA